jgi:hypothetical protein
LLNRKKDREGNLRKPPRKSPVLARASTILKPSKPLMYPLLSKVALLTQETVLPWSFKPITLNHAYKPSGGAAIFR